MWGCRTTHICTRKGWGEGKELSTRIPLGRLARAAEITNAILYLASVESSYNTGSEVVEDGGLTAQQDPAEGLPWYWTARERAWRPYV